MFVEPVVRSKRHRITANNLLPLQFCSVLVSVEISVSLLSVEVSDSRADTANLPSETVSFQPAPHCGVRDWLFLFFVDDCHSLCDGVPLASTALLVECVDTVDETQDTLSHCCRLCEVTAVQMDSW